MSGDPLPHYLLNGRFLLRPPTGVDRVATELVRAMNALQAEGAVAPFRLDVALPATGIGDAEIRERLNLPPESRILRSRHGGYFWEQIVLRGLEPGALLLSLCNIGPVFRSRQFVLMHDMQVFDVPESYSAQFRLVYRAILPRLALRSDGLGTVSEFSLRRMRANGIAVKREVTVIPNGIDHMVQVNADPAVPAKFGLEQGKYLLAVGSLAPHKNLAMLVSACGRRADSSVPLIIVGNMNAQIFSQEGGLTGDSVRNVGRVSDGELKALYENAAAFLFPSLTEGFGLPALEAMSCGCPVIASTGGAIPECCGDAALFCSPTNPDEWTKSIEALLENPAKRQELSDSGRRRAALFTWKASARKLLSALSGK